MKEVEAKILDIDRPVVEKRLRELGAEKVSEEELVALYYDMPEEEMLRIRTEERGVVICHKRNGEDAGIRSSDETELLVDNVEDAKNLLAALGYAERKTIRKRRTTYDLDGTVVLFDRFLSVDIPEFLEIEAADPETVKRVAKTLGFTEDALLPWTGSDVFRHYGKE